VRDGYIMSLEFEFTDEFMSLELISFDRHF